jgi:hypothetical protein
MPKKSKKQKTQRRIKRNQTRNMRLIKQLQDQTNTALMNQAAIVDICIRSVIGMVSDAFNQEVPKKITEDGLGLSFQRHVAMKRPKPPGIPGSAELVDNGPPSPEPASG